MHVRCGVSVNLTLFHDLLTYLLTCYDWHVFWRFWSKENYFRNELPTNFAFYITSYLRLSIFLSFPKLLQVGLELGPQKKTSVKKAQKHIRQPSQTFILLNILNFFLLTKKGSVNELKTASPVRRANMCNHAKFRADCIKPLPRYRDFWIFKDGGLRHLRFFKFQIWNGLNGVCAIYQQTSMQIC